MIATVYLDLAACNQPANCNIVLFRTIVQRARAEAMSVGTQQTIDPM